MSTLISINNVSTFAQQTFGPLYGMQANAPLTSLNLFDTGCRVNGRLNCTIACQNPSALWETAETLQNCMIYPAISLLLANDGLDEEGIETANRFGILPSPEHGTTITHSINGCAKDYCDNLPPDGSYSSWCLIDYTPPSSNSYTPKEIVDDTVRLASLFFASATHIYSANLGCSF